MATVQELMKLASDLADQRIMASRDRATSSDVDEARDALESALQQMVTEIENVKAERDVALGQLTILRTETSRLQAKLDEAQKQEPVDILAVTEKMPCAEPYRQDLKQLAFHLSMAKREAGWLVAACWTAAEVLSKINELGPLYARPIPSQDVNAGLVESYDDKYCATMKPGRVMQRAHALCPTDMPHVDRMAWMADFFTRNCVALSQSQAAPAQVVPDGWKLVPVEATTAMVNAGQCGCMDNDVTVCVWSAMLAAAPQPQEGAQS